MIFEGSPQKKKTAIAYYRHSAEDKQENSIKIQQGHVEEFAQKHKIEIIHQELDEGKSGLLAKRPGFERLFSDWIENPTAPFFNYILVYDVSRWGRFQNPDQSGYYEYLCTKHGKEVIYVSRGFTAPTNQLISSLETSIQRYMAAEYSRQLSDKVFHGCVKISQQGFSSGGTAPYGMTRLLLDINKNPVRILKRGEFKQIANERVIFSPLNDSTTDTIKLIFHLYVHEKRSILQIVERINRTDICTANGEKWNRSKVIKILKNEVYIGTRIYNKTWGRLKQKSYRNPRSLWVIKPNAFDAIINTEDFKLAQERLYWNISRNWRKGINSVRKITNLTKNNVKNWLLNKGLDEVLCNKIFNELPIIYGVKNHTIDHGNLCFLITERQRRFKNVLAIGIDDDFNLMKQDCFLLDLKEFKNSNYIILQDNTPAFFDQKIDQENIEEVIKNFIQQYITSDRYMKTKYAFVLKVL
jgi:DNA invertase Pin-like site-specific DNA recombinase